MPLFDRFIAVDWSAKNSPSTKAKKGADSIWIGDLRAGLLDESINPRTRHAAMEVVAGRLEDSLRRGERVLIGFDFPFAYPRGAALVLAGAADWQRLWRYFEQAITDDERNRSNRFHVAAALNQRLPPGGPRFWGCPASAASATLSPCKEGATFTTIPEFRHVERLAKGAKATWQLHYNGSVGSQCFVGLARLEKLRTDSALRDHIAVWPFETDFERDLSKPVVLAEIYPSLIKDLPDGVLPKDRAQVETTVRLFHWPDGQGLLGRLLSAPSAIDEDTRAMALSEEGWIVGAGHNDLVERFAREGTS